MSGFVLCGGDGAFARGVVLCCVRCCVDVPSFCGRVVNVRDELSCDCKVVGFEGGDDEFADVELVAGY